MEWVSRATARRGRLGRVRIIVGLVSGMITLRSIRFSVECAGVPLLRGAPEWILMCRALLAVRGNMAWLAVRHSTGRISEVGRPVAVLNGDDRRGNDVVVVDVTVGIGRERRFVAEISHGVVVTVAGSEVGRLGAGVAVKVYTVGALVVLPFADAPEGEGDESESEDANADEGSGDCAFVVPEARSERYQRC